MSKNAMYRNIPFLLTLLSVFAYLTVIDAVRCYAKFGFSAGGLSMRDFHHSEVNDSATCCEKCEASPECALWLFIGPNKGTTPDHSINYRCQIKKNISLSVISYLGSSSETVLGFPSTAFDYDTKEDVVKSALLDTHLQYTGTTLSTQTVEKENWSQCYDGCVQNPPCEAWTLSGTTCSLLDNPNARPLTLNLPYISGTINTLTPCRTFGLVADKQLNDNETIVITVKGVASHEAYGVECMGRVGCLALEYNEVAHVCRLTNKDPTVDPVIAKAKIDPDVDLYSFI